MNIMLHQDWEELRPFAADWDRVLAESCSDTIFLTWEWCEAWWNAYGGGRSLFVLTAWQGSELVGVAPFYAEVVRRWQGLWRCLRILGGGSGDSDYLDCFAKRGMEHEVVSSFMESLESVAHAWDWIQIECVPQDSPCMTELSRIAAEQGWRCASEIVPCAAVALPTEWGDYLRSLHPRVRTKVRSALAYFDQLEVEPAECASSSELDYWLTELFELHTRRWEKRNQPGVFRSESRQSFYLEVSRSTLQRGWLAFHRLAWGERSLALQFGFRYHNRLYVLQEGYDPGFERLRPGVALRGWIMRDEIKRGLAEYDFLAGAARHKLDWGARPKLCRSVLFAKKPIAACISISIPSFSRSLRESAGRLLPSHVRSWRKHFLAQHQCITNVSGVPRVSLPSRLFHWSTSHLYSRTPLGSISRRLANRHAARHHGLESNPEAAPVFAIFRYHRVNDDGDPFFNALPVSQFRAQMQYLIRHFRPVSMDELTKGQLASSERCSAAVTFDDGYHDNFIYAFPILREMGIPATIFLATGSINSRELPWYDQVRLAFKLTRRPQLSLHEIGGPRTALRSEAERLMAMELTLTWLRTVDDCSRVSYLPELFRNLGVPHRLNLPATMLSWDEIRRMSRHCVTFGAHTVTHPVLGTLSVSRLHEEIFGSKTTIEDRLQMPVWHFAYPFGKRGDFTPHVKGVVQAASFRTAVTTIPGFNRPEHDALELRRLSIAEHDPAVFGLKLDWSTISASAQQVGSGRGIAEI